MNFDSWFFCGNYVVYLYGSDENFFRSLKQVTSSNYQSSEDFSLSKWTKINIGIF